MSAAALALALALVVAPQTSARAQLNRSKILLHNNFQISGGPAGWVLSGLAVPLIATVFPLSAVLAAAVLVTTFVVSRRRRHRRARRTRESVALQGALGILVGELRAGAHPVAAFEAAAQEVGGEVAAALAEVAARARLGADVAAGLAAVAAHSALPGYWQRLAVYWALARDHGLAISPLMRAGERDIVVRERFSSRIHSAMAGARATAAVLAGLPLLGLLLGQLIGAQPLRFLLGGGAGGVVLVVGVTLSCLGLLWSDLIIGRVDRE